MFKKTIAIVILTAIISVSVFAGPLFSVDKQKGGCVPCLVGALDTRSAYVVNEKKVNIELLDVLKIVTNYLIPIPVFNIYNMYTGFSNDGVSGCCLGMYSGRYSVTSLTKYKTRTKEKFAWLLIPGIQMAIEVFNGKTWSEVVEQEHLKK